MRVEFVYDLIAPIYGKFVPPMVERTIRRAVQRVSAGMPQNLLEVGVGPGKTISLVSKKTGAQTVALDISRNMLKTARNETRRAKVDTRFVQGNVLDLPFPDGSFDAVFCTFMMDLLHPADVDPAIRDMARVLTPGGRMVIAQLNMNPGPLKLAWKLTYSLLPDAVGIPQPVELSDTYEDVGMRILQDEEIAESVGTRVTTMMKVRG